MSDERTPIAPLGRLRLVITRGLPASGKTTYARTWVADQPEGTAARVNRDEIRFNLFGKWWGLTHQQEGQVSAAQRATVEALLRAGVSVIVDDTNLVSRFARAWQQLAADCGAGFVVVDVPTEVETCVQRDQARAAAGERAVGAEVITKMATRFGLHRSWLPDLPPLAADEVAYRYEPDTSKPEGWIVDIDGTLAHMNGRGPFEWHRVGEDDVNLAVRSLCGALYEDYDVVLLSGRDSVCREQTEDWLLRHNVDYDVLFMRPEGDSRKDAIVKLEMFRELVASNWNVRAVVDDRDQVVAMWRQIGLVCFQAAPGNF